MLLFVEQLTNVDFSYLHPSRGLLGETWLADVSLEGELDAQGMVCDFGDVKKTLRRFLDTELDHRLLVPTRAPQLQLALDGDELRLHWRADNGEQLYCRSPRQAIALIDAEAITPESVARWSVEQLSAGPLARLGLALSFSQEAIDGASYHYSHGLKKHAGNCQRIAHGHRSRIEIFRNGRPALDLEEDWAGRWRDIYLATRSDIKTSGEQLAFAYRSAQGEFEIQLPASRCYLLDTDTTVEWLAAHIAQTLAAEQPGDEIRVRAFEGYRKGAQAIAKI